MEQKSFVRVAAVKDVPPGTMKGVDVHGVPVVLCNVNGELYAVHDECTHETYPLSEGTLEGHSLTCMLHGACFDVRTGAVLALPAYDALETFDVQVDGEDVLISLD